MQSKDLLKMALEMNMGMTLPLIEDMRDAPLTFPTPNGGNHPLWVLGHLTYSAANLIQEMMLGKADPLAEWKGIFNFGTEPTSDAAMYPPFDEVLAKCKEVHQANLAVLDSLSEEDLDTPSKGCPPEYAEYFGTYRQCFLMSANHWLFHYGQVADARRAAGRKPLMT